MGITIVLARMVRNLLLTVIIETVIALLLKARHKTDIKNIIIINCITNPILNYVMLIVAYFVSNRIIIYTVLFAFEMIVVYSEYKYYQKKLNYNNMNLLGFSAILNASSYFVGLAIIKLISL